jgi:two-component system, NtrC family, sensor kinase
MTAGIAHEVNNPLSSILLYSELLMAGDIQPKMRKDLRLIHDEAERAARTMSDLLNYARGIETSVRKVNLNALVRKVLQVRSYQHGVKNIRVIRKLSRTPLYTKGDDNQLTQVIMNIVMNAEDSLAETKGGEISITSEVGSKWGRLIISDTGKGIDEEHLQKIFFPFFTTKKYTRRSGLGLSVCYGIVTRHHGFIRAENNPEGGASFIVELPLVQVKHRAAAKPNVLLEQKHEQA